MARMTIRPLTDSDRSAVGAVLAADGGYAQRVHGRPPESDDVTGLFTARPPATQPEQKHLLGLFLGRELMGVADLATDWPEPGVNFLGLLQLRADAQGQGLARRFHDHLLSAFPAGQEWRLNVVDTNAEVQPFWEHLGYRDTGQRKSWTSPTGLEHEVVVLARES
ncbi:GNAT family N-acetyltransferase [Micrococcus sp.]|uniref:GNAT family N-acetyltransferase n=1 Tax=Micrococcus sp. TaxID=1271 RepID=UPI0026DBC130|nr:GNAT family N-acetyltransferase [Micrococcus sp.]MDO4240598.1 GNAT family N-acetyltransferase [Micrococcus sp.]